MNGYPSFAFADQCGGIIGRAAAVAAFIIACGDKNRAAAEAARLMEATDKLDAATPLSQESPEACWRSFGRRYAASLRLLADELEKPA